MVHIKYLSIITFSLLILSCKVEELKAPPVVKTNSTSEISANTAKIWGEVVEEGTSSASERGFVYSEKSPSPSTSDNKVVSGFGKGEFNYTLINLLPNTKYYFKAYATNQTGIAYGDAKDFTTTEDIKLPTIITGVISNISYNTCTAGGNITSTGGVSLSEKGIVYATSQNPTTANTKIISTDGNSFSINVTDLIENTTYYVRAFATNSKGTSYGEQQTFTTLKNFNLILKNGLVAYYPFNGNANDASENKYNGTINNVTLTTDRNGNNNSAYLFNKSSIDIGKLPKLGNSPTSFTQSAWILAPQDQSIYCKLPIMSKRQEQTYASSWVSLGAGGNGTISVPWNGQAYLSVNVHFYAQGIINANVSTSKTTDGKWHLITGVKEGSTYKLYFDGVLQSTKTDNTEFFSDKNMTIGYEGCWGFDCERYFNGKIDDVGIWNRALSADEVKILFENNFQP